MTKFTNIECADWKLYKIAEAHNELNKSYFETGEYVNYESYFKLKEALQWIIEQSKDKSLNIADIGCGSGWHAVYLKREGLIPPLKYTGYDLSSNMCDFAMKNFPEANFNILDICKNCITPSYNIIMESAVLELSHDWNAALINILRSSNLWIIFHRLFTKNGVTVAEQVETYHKIPDIRLHIGMDDFKKILNNEKFELVRSDIWRKGLYNLGTYICRKI